MPPAPGWNAELLLSSGSLRWRSNQNWIVTIIEARGSCCVSCSEWKPCSQALTLEDRRQVTTIESGEIVFLECLSFRFLDLTGRQQARVVCQKRQTMGGKGTSDD